MPPASKVKTYITVYFGDQRQKSALETLAVSEGRDKGRPSLSKTVVALIEDGLRYRQLRGRRAPAPGVPMKGPKEPSR